MPIKFRCPNCRQFLGISRAKAGSLTDCPTCGHSIRVPALDGTVAPLSAPELDFGDSGLARALDVLAQLDGGKTPSASGTAAVAGPGTSSPAAAVAAAVTAAVAAPPAPVPIAVPVREVPVATERAVPRTTTAPDKSRSRGLEAPLSALDGIGESSPVLDRLRRKPASGAALSPLWLGAGGLVVGGLLGFVAGRFSVAAASPSPVAAKPAAAPLGSPPAPAGIAEPQGGIASAPAPAKAAAAVPANAEFRTALTGRITYTNENGESRPDEGARILVFSDTRQGSGKLPVVGFLAGAGEADVRLSRASLRAIGGDFAVADSQGQYEISLPAAGTYQVLLMSRYQEQKDAPVLENSLRKLLESYFDRPNRLIGLVRYHYDSFRFDGAAPTIKGHGFTR